MRILYVANHNCGDNDDEGAITFALRSLGHTVHTVHEKARHRAPGQRMLLGERGYDFCLFHKWATVSELAEVRVPCAFWYFDMIRPVDGDTSLLPRSESRVKWMADVLRLPNVVAGFCTDGDWVLDCPLEGREKLYWLTQGADERVAGFGTSTVRDHPPILFTGMKHHGRKRAEHIDRLKERYGERFVMLGDGGPKYRVHGRALADLFAAAKVVVAPDGPSTDRYWSNRVWLTLSLGGFLLHPHCARLREFYTPAELECYRTRDELEEMIDWYLDDADARRKMAQAGHAATINNHLYRYRCVELVKVMEGRL